MMRSNMLMKTSACALAVGLHAGIGFALWGDASVQIEGGAGGSQARIGNSFADMAVGVMTAQAISEDERIEPTDSAALAAITPADTLEATALTRQAPQTLARMANTAAQPPAIQQAALTAAVVPNAKPVLAAPQHPQHQPALTLTQPVMAASHDVTQTVTATNAAFTQTIESPLKAQAPDVESPTPADPKRVKAVRAVQSPDIVTAVDPDAMDRSLRPPRRPHRIEEHHAKPVSPPKPKSQKPKATRGNAKVAATAGAVSGVKQARAVQQGDGSGQSQHSGTAAANNYGGAVMRKIARVPKPRVNAAGAAIVSLSIAQNGGLLGVSISNSSGSAALDQAALRVVQRAAPFPPPPTGARTRFAVRIEGAG